jgi:SMC interacting uncharacterized protein involved in chromosome segregation
MEEVKRETDYLNSEEFRLEMQKAGEEMRVPWRKPEEIAGEYFNSEEFRKEMQKSMEELNKNLQKIGPSIQESLKEIRIDEIMREVFDSLEKAFPDTTGRNE